MRQKIFDRHSLFERITACRLNLSGFRLVFTNGCFDLLHVGHTRYLQAARREGDVLCVALNDDESIRRLKGPERPVLKLNERLQLIAGLACVDYVTWFEEDTPIPLIELLKPEILVKGANYGVEGVVGRVVAEQYGAVVKTLQLTENSSTTKLIERVRALSR